MAIVRDRWISLDMAVSVFRSVDQANFFINAIKKFRCEKVVTFAISGVLITPSLSLQ